MVEGVPPGQSKERIEYGSQFAAILAVRVSIGGRWLCLYPQRRYGLRAFIVISIAAIIPIVVIIEIVAMLHDRRQAQKHLKRR
jgi:hypothetical protein